MSDFRKMVLVLVVLGAIAAVAMFFAFSSPAMNTTVPNYYISGNLSGLPAGKIVVTIDRTVQNFTIR